MNKLKTYKFSDLYKMSSGISTTKEQAGHGAPFLSFKNVFDNYFLPTSLSDLMDTSEREQETYSIKKGDIFLTRTSETLDELGMSSVAINDYPKATYSGFLKRLRPIQDDITYDKYMAFYLRSKLFRKTMNNNAIMTLRASLNEQIFSYLDIVLPDFDEQVKIGDFLYGLHAKIQINNQINKELEAMAKLIYDYWFVQFDFPITEEYAQSVGRPDLVGKPYKSSGGKMVYHEKLKREIPEGWEVGNILMWSSLKGGGTPKTNEPCNWEGEIPFFTPSDSSGSIYSLVTKQKITEKGLSSCSSKKFDKGTIFLTARGTVGKVNIAAYEMAMNQSCYALEAAKPTYSPFLYFYTKNLVFYLKAKANGSTFKSIVSDDIKFTLLPVPPTEIVDIFSNIIGSVFLKILTNEKEKQKMIELRDWLLPMLMNGQVRVK